MTRHFVVLLLALFALAAPASAQTFPALTGRVVDQANLLRPEQEFDLSSKSETLEAQTKRQFVVATVNSLEGLPIEDYAYRLGRAWKIGDQKRDDGVILLVAPNERKVWIATGYGSGAFLTDAVSGVIVREAIFRSSREPARLRGGYYSRRRRDHQADVASAGSGASQRRQGASAGNRTRKCLPELHPGLLHRHCVLHRHRLAVAPVFGRPQVSPSAWRGRRSLDRPVGSQRAQSILSRRRRMGRRWFWRRWRRLGRRRRWRLLGRWRIVRRRRSRG